jgi:hypothetical protein
MDAVVADQATPTPAVTATPAPSAAPAATTPETPSLQDTLLAGGPVTPPAPAADGKDGSDGKPDQGAPAVEYDLKGPEGVELPAAYVEGLTALAKEHGLTPKAAQALLDRDVAGAQAAQAAQRAAWTEQVATWRGEVEKHPKLGGEHFARTVADARRALALAPPELHTALRESGYGNHPLLVAWAAAIGAKMGESALVTGDQSATRVRSPADDFPNTPVELGGSKKD